MTAQIIKFTPNATEADDLNKAEVAKTNALANEFFACMSEEEKTEFLAEAETSKESN